MSVYPSISLSLSAHLVDDPSKVVALLLSSASGLARQKEAIWGHGVLPLNVSMPCVSGGPHLARLISSIELSFLLLDLSRPITPRSNAIRSTLPKHPRTSTGTA